MTGSVQAIGLLRISQRELDSIHGRRVSMLFSRGPQYSRKRCYEDDDRKPTTTDAGTPGSSPASVNVCCAATIKVRLSVNLDETAAEMKRSRK